MSSFVLVHGAWHGSWCWKRVRTALQAEGHEVFTPTLTGLADRSHLLSRAVNLETHIQDVVNLIRWEELTDIVLCGHSYGGCVVSGVADRMPEHIRAWCTWMPSCSRTVTTRCNTSRRRSVPPVRGRGEHHRGGLEGAAGYCGRIQRQRRRPRVGGSAMHDATDRNDAATNPASRGASSRSRTSHSSAPQDSPKGSPFPPFYEKAKAKGWKTRTVPCGHDVMLDLPEELTTLLVEARSSSSTVLVSTV